MALITFTEQQNIKPLSKHMAPRFDQYATEAEELYLNKLLGAAFTQAIQTTPAEYTDLLDGSTFKDCAGNTVKHKGLKYCLAYWIFSENIETSDVAMTFSGPVTKQRDDARGLAEGRVKRIQQQTREQGGIAFALVKDFLNANTDIYPLWSPYKYKKVHAPKFASLRQVERDNDFRIRYYD